MKVAIFYMLILEVTFYHFVIFSSLKASPQFQPTAKGRGLYREGGTIEGQYQKREPWQHHVILG